MIEQQNTIAQLETKVSQLEEKVGNLDEQLTAAKKLKGKPQIRPSRLNSKEKQTGSGEKRAGSNKRSKKLCLIVDEQRVIEPEGLPEGAQFNGYREYDVQDLVLKRHNVRFLLAEYVTPEGKSIVGKLPGGYRNHYGATLLSFVLYQHCAFPGTAAINFGATQRTGHRYFGWTGEPDTA